MTDYGFRGNAGSSSSAIKLRIYFWNPSLLLDAAPCGGALRGGLAGWTRDYDCEYRTCEVAASRMENDSGWRWSSETNVSRVLKSFCS